MADKSDPSRVAARNRKARHNYTIEDDLEAGIVLSGSEVKSLRAGRSNIAEAYAIEKDGEIWLFNAYIPEYHAASNFNHETRRPRKLLLSRREINKLIGRVQKEGIALVPLDIHFNKRGIAKVRLAVGLGKKKYDKRQSEKDRDWNRQKARLLREKG